jgi:hypothetical protein
MTMKDRQTALNHRLKAAGNDEASAGLILRCECADLRCNARLELTKDELSRRREHPGWYWVKPGHELPSRERAVQGCTRFSVVMLEATPF